MAFTFLQRIFLKSEVETKPMQTSNLIKWHAVIATNKGARKDVNEDRAAFIQASHRKNKLGSLAMICDGMGGHNAGDVAAQLAVDTIEQAYYNSKSDPSVALKKAVVKANKTIFKSASENHAYYKMGTTCTTVTLFSNAIYIANIGDSRCYLVQKDKIVQLTQDDTYVNYLFQKGLISLEEMNNHPDRHMVTKVLGTKSEVAFDVQRYELPVDEDFKLFLCSDGLYDYITDEEICRRLQPEDDSMNAEEMIREVLRLKGHDNVSLIILQKETKAD